MGVKVGRVVGWATGQTVLVIASLVLVARVEASPIRSHHLAAHVRTAEVATQAADRWQLYFQEALANHWLHVRIPARLRALSVGSNGLLPDTAFVEYLRWRHSLDPARFDRYHPRIGPLLEREQVIRTAIFTPTTPPPPTPILGAQTVTLPHTQVPEPSAGLIAVALFASAAWARHRAARSD